MNYQINDFIGVFENSLDHNVCDGLIDMFEGMDSLHQTINRQHNDTPHIFKDNSFYFPHTHKECSFRNKNSYPSKFVDSVSVCYKIYADCYGVINSLSPHSFYEDIKIQKTLPTQGYHIWHCEQGNRFSSTRMLLVLTYLNDVEEGGETEFLYQSRRIKPKKGTTIICPGGFTHTHRGNPPLSGVKYVINGWIEFIE